MRVGEGASAAYRFISVSLSDGYGTRAHGRRSFAAAARKATRRSDRACDRTSTRSLTGLYRRLRNLTESAVLSHFCESARGLVHQRTDAITAGGELHRTLRTCVARLCRHCRVGDYTISRDALGATGTAKQKEVSPRRTPSTERSESERTRISTGARGSMGIRLVVGFRHYSVRAP